MKPRMARIFTNGYRWLAGGNRSARTPTLPMILAACCFLLTSVVAASRPYGTTFVAPLEGAVYEPGSTTLTATCAGVDTATVYDNNTVVGTLPFFPPYTLTLNLSGSGAHVIRAVGCDPAGRLVTNSMTITVVEALPRLVKAGASAGSAGSGAAAD